MSRCFRRRMLLRVVLSLTWVVTACHLQAAEPTDLEKLRSQRTLEHARMAARFDMEGDQAYRDYLLTAALRDDPDYQLARWQMGYVRDADGWFSVRERSRPSSPADAVQEDYILRRDLSFDRAHDELELANWCRRNQLKDQADLHYRRVLDNTETENVMRKTAAKKLGLRMLAGKWVSAEEIDEYGVMIRRAEKNLVKWSGRILKWARSMNRPQSAKAMRALDELRTVRDASAIPALELILSGINQRLASESVLVIAGIPGNEATQSLVRRAMASVWPRARNEAAV